LFEPKSGRRLHFDDSSIIEIYLLKGIHEFNWVIGAESLVEQYTESQLPEEFRLNDAYPNPFNPSTTISFALPKASAVDIQVYDIAGRKVATLVNASLAAGYHQIVWDASRLASGVYIVDMRAGSFRATGKVALVK
jgi:hypothetical protein